MAEQTKQPTFEVLEEDDEFEEFQEKDWTEKEQDQSDPVQFSEDWDDTELDDDFVNRLRTELQKN
eukprot:CAMPEP_0114386578 /NCGR_PEP_ID=MMETSP0102-20121206/6714_1 /TAXON_ID=38822 ORGANISM="Pteridomonas danica, Strain PT" /NCGR_SAMPLE_ID=MMETSP0102 /ASSEMBLY_ACC=CAM_ASM_000212 /LENGTH=64 /DNA_ID=CAMNT_0001543449 /DNA_START=29 /DNA_END=223 /DNA_ORIENTATION=-